MNHLAHIYLSGDDDGLKIGNFIADSVKGRAYQKYPESIQKGILLHRKIDEYTDKHPVTRQSIAKFSSDFGLYAGVIVDMVYDHFLAANWKDYHPTPLEIYAQEFYSLIDKHIESLPKRVQNFFPYMKRDNWLVSYARLSGLEEALFQMNPRIKTGTQLHFAIKEVRKNHISLENEFQNFFNDLKCYLEEEIP